MYHRLTGFMVMCFFVASTAAGGSMDDFIAEAEAAHGDAGGRAARFLVEHMPEGDRDALDAAFLGENLDLAQRARETFSWAAPVPEALYFNDVLPYAVLNEPREGWRQDFFEKASHIVRDAKSATEAAQWLNRDFFNAIDVHYHTQRRRTNQSPSESIEQGRATCTGLSIILVYACRAVGIPARAAGTPMWTNKRGNHTWVEFWDGDWHFVGADEYDPAGADRGWFTGAASKALENDPVHAIYATSWKATGLTFPMAWSPKDGSVSAVNVTSRYADPAPASPELGVRRLSPEGKRVAVKGVLTTAAGMPVATFMTRSEPADLNDVPRLPVEPGRSYRLRFEDRETEAFVAREGTATRDVRDGDLSPVPDLETMPRRDLVARATALAYEQVLETSRRERLEELETRSITLGEHQLKWLETTYGEAPEDGRSLWISMHGGGGAPASVNDQQWRNQARLYQPEEGVYVAPRGPTDTWNLWHRGHIDPLFQRLIENFVALRGVNPDKVYLMGYSAGGDGVWQLAPRMADRFAAAAMMAGHPNEASLLGLRNLPFAVFVGGEDKAYKRNAVVAERIEQLEALHRDDPDGYTHLPRVYEGLGHWMEGKDAEALPWMAGFSRNPWPTKLVWYQDDVTHDRFYWLKLPRGTATKGQKIAASVNQQQIDLEGDVPSGTRLRLSDELLDLDQDITVRVNGDQVFSGRVARRFDSLTETLTERLDPAAAACAEVPLSW